MMPITAVHSQNHSIDLMSAEEKGQYEQATEIISKDKRSIDDVESLLNILIGTTLQNIPKQDFKANFDYYCYVLGLIIDDLKLTNNIDSEIYEKFIYSLMNLLFFINEYGNNCDGPLPFNRNDISCLSSKIKTASVPENTYLNPLNPSTAQPFIKFVSKMFPNILLAPCAIIEYILASSSILQKIYPDEEFKELQKADQILFECLEYNEESLPVIVELVPEIENPLGILLLQFILNISGFEFNCKKIEAQPLPKAIVETKSIDYLSAARLLTYVKGDIVQLPSFLEIEDINMATVLLLANEIEMPTFIKAIFPLDHKLVALAMAADAINQNSEFTTKLLKCSAKQHVSVVAFVIDKVVGNPSVFIDAKRSANDINAARRLVDKPECVKYLGNSTNHLILKTIHSHEVKLTEEIDIYNAINACRFADTCPQIAVQQTEPEQPPTPEQPPETTEAQDSPQPEVENALNSDKEKVTFVNPTKEEIIVILEKAATAVQKATEEVEATEAGRFLLRADMAPPSSPDSQIKNPPKTLSDFFGLTTQLQIVNALLYHLFRMLDESFLGDVESSAIKGLTCHRLLSQETQEAAKKAIGPECFCEVQRENYMAAINAAKPEDKLTVALACGSSTNLAIQSLDAAIDYFGETDPESLTRFFTLCSGARFFFCKLGPELFEKTLRSFAMSGSLETVKDITIPSEEPKLSIALKIAGECAPSYPAISQIIIDSIKVAVTDIDPFLNAVPELKEEPSPAFFNVVQNVAEMARRESRGRPKFSAPPPRIVGGWSESAVEKEKMEQTDIWKGPSSVGRCLGGNVGPRFLCHTCNCVMLCARCAELCHRHHDVEMCCSSCSDPCQCGPNCQCINDDNAIPVESKEGSKSADRAASPLAVASLVSKLARSPRPEVVQKLARPVRLTSDLSKMHIPENSKFVTEPPCVMKVVPNASVLCTNQKIRRAVERINESFVMTRRRADVAPMRLVTPICGGKFIFAANGCRCSVYNKDFSKSLSSIKMPKAILTTAVNPVNDSMIAVSSLHNVYILGVDDKGIVTQTCEIELVLQALGNYIFVNNILWVPGSEENLAVVCNTFIKIYNVVVDVMCPVGYFSTGDRKDYITSACFVVREGKPFLIVSISNETIAVQDALQTSIEGPIVFSKIDKTGVCGTLSYDSEDDLLFLSSPNQIIIMRSAQIFEENPEWSKIHTEFRGCVSFASKHPQMPGVLLFHHTNTGGLFSLEFIDVGIEIAKLTSKELTVGNLAILDNALAMIDCFALDGKLYSVSPTGVLVELVPNVDGDAEADTVLGQNEEEDECEDEPFEVPRTFWTTSQITRDNVDVRSPSHDSYRDLLNGSRYIISSRHHRKTMEVTLNDNDRVIVGFRVCVGSNSESHRPPWIRLCSRKTEVGCQRGFMLPLRPSEIAAKRTYRIRLGNRRDNDINFDRLEVFTVPLSSILEIVEAARRTADWRESASLCDFKPGHSSEPLGVAALALASAFVPSPLPPSLIRELVYASYVRQDVAEGARAVAAAASVDGPESKEDLWAEAAEAAVKDGKVCETRSGDFWRDFTRLPPSAVPKIADAIFAGVPPVGAEGVVMAAFFATK